MHQNYHKTIEFRTFTCPTATLEKDDRRFGQFVCCHSWVYETAEARDLFICLDIHVDMCGWVELVYMAQLERVALMPRGSDTLSSWVTSICSTPIFTLLQFLNSRVKIKFQDRFISCLKSCNLYTSQWNIDWRNCSENSSFFVYQFCPLNSKSTCLDGVNWTWTGCRCGGWYPLWR